MAPPEAPVALGEDDTGVRTNMNGLLTESLGFESYDKKLERVDQMVVGSLWALR